MKQNIHTLAEHPPYQIRLETPSQSHLHSKIAHVIAVLGRAEGGTMQEIENLTSWCAPSVRAALTSLRKKGHPIIRFSCDGQTAWRTGTRV